MAPNGPWLSERLRERGVELAHIIVVADRRGDLRGALDFLQRAGMDLVITSGGLGPTADDLTAEVVGEFAGRPAAARLLTRGADRASILRNRDTMARVQRGGAKRAGNRKQAIVPEGATILEPVG